MVLKHLVSALCLDMTIAEALWESAISFTDKS